MKERRGKGPNRNHRQGGRGPAVGGQEGVHPVDQILGGREPQPRGGPVDEPIEQPLNFRPPLADPQALRGLLDDRRNDQGPDDQEHDVRIVETTDEKRVQRPNLTEGRG